MDQRWSIVLLAYGKGSIAAFMHAMPVPYSLYRMEVSGLETATGFSSGREKMEYDSCVAK